MDLLVDSYLIVDKRDFEVSTSYLRAGGFDAFDCGFLPASEAVRPAHFAARQSRRQSPFR
jgi:hypothetical protein